MYFTEIHLTQGTTNLNRTTEKTIQLQEAKPNELTNYDLAVAQGGSVLAFIVFWTGCLMVLYKNAKLNSDDRSASSTKECHKSPCKGCQYFSNNQFLKCAVQPGMVLTEEAIHCSDYYPKADGDRQKFKFKFWK